MSHKSSHKTFSQVLRIQAGMPVSMRVFCDSLCISIILTVCRRAGGGFRLT